VGAWIAGGEVEVPFLANQASAVVVDGDGDGHAVIAGGRHLPGEGGLGDGKDNGGGFFVHGLP
jgi:hypothetical protein